MKLNFDQLKHYRVQATDTLLGNVKDVYFDDASFRIRYLVVDTEKWLPGHKVIIAPEAVMSMDENNKRIDVNLSKDQVDGAPRIKDIGTLTRDQQDQLHDYYGWQKFWQSSDETAIVEQLWFLNDDMAIGEIDIAGIVSERVMPSSPLRSSAVHSCRGIKGCAVLCSNAGQDVEKTGKVDDFLLNCTEWTLPYFVVDAKLWRIGGRVLVPSRFMTQIDESLKSVRTNVSEDVIKNAPEFERHESFDLEDERGVIEYYASSLRGESIRGEQPIGEERPTTSTMTPPL